MPKTRLGRWAGGLAAAFVALVLFSVLTIGRQNMAGVEGGVSWLQPGEPVAIGLGTFMLATGLASFVAGLVSLIKLKDRSIVVILAVIVGLLAVLILVMELLEGMVG